MNAAAALLVALVGCGHAVASGVPAEVRPGVGEPRVFVYASPGGVDLKAFVFSSNWDSAGEPGSGIVLFHGGGWVQGEPEWAFARAVILWMRSQAKSLGIAQDRIAAYGWSARAHLAASAAIFDDAQRLLGQRGSARDLSPDRHVREGLPPTLILQGNTDTVTPLNGVKRYCELLRAAKNRCELQVYEGFGHLFTPAGIPDDGMPKTDPATAADVLARTDRFLTSMGFQR